MISFSCQSKNYYPHFPGRETEAMKNEMSCSEAEGSWGWSQGWTPLFWLLIQRPPTAPLGQPSVFSPLVSCQTPSRAEPVLTNTWVTLEENIFIRSLINSNLIPTLTFQVAKVKKWINNWQEFHFQVPLCGSRCIFSSSFPYFSHL